MVRWLRCRGQPERHAASPESAADRVFRRCWAAESCVLHFVSLQPNAPRAIAKQFLAIGGELHGGEEIRDTVAGKRLVNGAEMGTCLIEPSGERQRERRD